MKTRHFIFSLMFLLGCISCSDDDPEPQEITNGDIVGFVKLFDDGTTALSNADMTVRIDGLNMAAKTDAEGKFTLKDVPFGTYNLIYEKSGYGTYKRFGIQHYKNFVTGHISMIEDTPLGQLSSTRVTNLSAEVIGTDLVLTMTTDPAGSDGQERGIVCYYGSTQYFGENFVIGDDNAYWGIHIDTQSNPHVIKIPLDEFGYDSDWGYYLFSPGESVFFRAFGESYYDNHYFDPNLETMVRPNRNPSAADQVSIVIP